MTITSGIPPSEKNIHMQTIIHLIWDGTHFHLWMESLKLFRKVWQEKEGQFKKASRWRHPFTLSCDQLEATFTTLYRELGIKLSSDLLLLFLPSFENKPLPSNLVQKNSFTEESMNLMPWMIEALRLPPHLVLDFLLSLPLSPPKEIAYSSSLLFWLEAAKFAHELIINKSFIPVIHEENEDNGMTSLRASWEAVIKGADNDRLLQLISLMPPYCRAFREKTEPTVNLLISFINKTIDAFVRRNIKLIFHSPSPQLPQKEAGIDSLAKKWFRMLFEPRKQAINYPTSLVKKFSKNLNAWLEQAIAATSDVEANFRVCFQLEAPTIDSTDEDWQISFYLQSKTDPSLLISAKTIWKNDSTVLNQLQEGVIHPQEQLLAGLGKASQLFSAIEKSLQTAYPVSLHLNTEEAFTFLEIFVPKLSENGFGVRIPSWWKQPERKLGIKLEVKRPEKDSQEDGKGLFRLNALANFDWRVAIGDQNLSAGEFARLVAQKVPIVRIQEQWVKIDKKEMEDAVNFAKKKSKLKTFGDLIRYTLAQKPLEKGASIVTVESEGVLGEAISTLTGQQKYKLLETPKNFKGKLRPYQENGFSFLVFMQQCGFGACLADDMGLGKTIQLIVVLLHEQAANQRRLLPTLLICPLTIVGNWYKELERFAPSLKVMIHHGTGRPVGEAFAKSALKHDLVITTYSLAYRDYEELSTIKWRNIVLDEAQNIKNHRTKQARVIKKLSADNRIALTGTPIENRLDELWSIIDFLNPGYLSSYTKFRAQFAIPIEKYQAKESAEKLSAMIRPFILRRLKTDPKVIADLPEKIESKVYWLLTKEQASLYKAVVQELLEKIDKLEGIQRKGLVLATLTKLKQVCNHPMQYTKDNGPIQGRSGKLIRLTEMLEKVLAIGDRALIFTQYVQTGEMLQKYLQEVLGCEVLFLFGATPKKDREEMVERFQEEKNPKAPKLFILSLKAGGVGLNLTAANHVFHFDRWWNPAVENQATDRAFRIGQTKKVQVHKFVSLGTLEERIDQLIEQKKELAATIISSSEKWLTELSTNELREMLQLSIKLNWSE